MAFIYPTIQTTTVQSQSQEGLRNWLTVPIDQYPYLHSIKATPSDPA